MTDRVVCVVDARAEAGESPVWSVREQALYWVDIWGRRVHRFDPGHARDRAFPMPDIVTFVAPHADGGLIACLGASVWHVEFDRTRFQLVAELPLRDGARLNDATIAPDGALVVGSMASDPAASDGALWRIGIDGRVSRLVEGLRSPNGLAFTADGDAMYLSDSHPAVRAIWRFDYATSREGLGRRALLRGAADLPGRPDGGCCDRQGRYWTAAIDGWAVVALDVDGAVVARVDLPVEKPSKPAFGGAALDTLYITSLRRSISGGIDAQPLAGGVFAADVHATGFGLPMCVVPLSV